MKTLLPSAADTRDSKLSRYDYIVILLCILGAALNVFLFWRDLNSSIERLSETPIGTITFKRNAAQRRFIDRVLWDRLREESPIYNGDTIRTAELSEAIVTFASSGNQITLEMDENSLVQIFVNEAETRFNLSGGGVNVASTQSPGAVVLTSGANRVELAPGGVVNADTQADAFRLRVLEGAASFENEAGVQRAEAGSALSILSDGTAALEPLVTMLEPRPATRILSPSRDNFPARFVWRTANFAPDQYVKIEIATDGKFSRIIQTFAMREDQYEAEIPLSAGTFYWRAFPVRSDSEASGAEAVKGKLSVLVSLPPRLVSPATNDVFRYRTRQPAIRFVWDTLEGSPSYELSVADNPAMTNPLISRRTREAFLVTQGLGAGTWYWQVMPLYSGDFAGTGSPSRVSSFAVRQDASLSPPLLLTPAADGFVSITRDTYFSWKPDSEAAGYGIQISRDARLANPVIRAEVSGNLYSCKANVLPAGQYYWGVFSVDAEGSRSSVSEPRSFVALVGEAVQRTVFPPDNYSIAENLVPDIRFTWKTNLPFPTRFQVSASQVFSSFVHDTPVTSQASQIGLLAPGTYYWRIAAEAPQGIIASATKTFTVLPPLDEARAIAPVPGSGIAVMDTLALRWEPVDGADYYQVKLYAAGKLAYENLSAGGGIINISADGLPDEAYIWTIQAFSYETALSSRRSGRLGTYGFRLRHIRPVSLDAPAHGAKFEGLTALRHPANVLWSTPEPLASSRFILSRNANPASGVSVVMNINGPPRRIPLARLPAGVYYWTILATTEDGMNISASSPYSFRVLPIPPLPEPANRRPEDMYMIGPAQLRQTRAIVFQWDAVRGANRYILNIYQLSQPVGAQQPVRRRIMRRAPASETSYTLEDLSLLDRGDFIWQVEAVFAAKNGTIEQRGIVGENRFTIDIPQPEKPRTADPGALYGGR